MRSLALVAVLVAAFAACSSSGDGASDGPNGSGGPARGGPDGVARPGDPDAAAPITYRHYDLNQVLSTGASDCVANGAPALTDEQPFENVMFDVGVMTGHNPPSSHCDGYGCKAYETPSSLVPLVEGDTFIDDDPVETMASGLANQATVFATEWFARVGLPARGHAILVSNHGRSGNAYDCLRKGSCEDLRAGYVAPFDEAMQQVESAKALAEAMGKTHVVRAVTAIAGQSEHDDEENALASYVYRTDGSGELIGNYTNALIEWQHDYETEVRKITKQAEPVPLFVSQFGSYTETVESFIPQRQLDAHVQAPGKVIVVTPNYPLKHFEDCNHYSNYSQRRLGAYFAKAYQRVVVEGGVWEPMRPLSITRAGKVITVKFLVPVPPLVFDTERVVDPGNFGFDYSDSTGSASIVDVARVVPDTVTITLSDVPTGDDRRLRYAMNMIPLEGCPGPTQGARGNLRDSDATRGYYDDEDGAPNELFNWSVAFKMPVP